MSEAEPKLHVACIMDGNGRWAAARAAADGRPHRRARRTWPASCAWPWRDVGWLTVFGFSTENWIRPRAEVSHILGLHEKLFGRVASSTSSTSASAGSAARSTSHARTPKYVQRAIRKAIADTVEATPAWCSPSPSTTAAGRS